MIRFVAGFLAVWGSVGGMELGSLSPIAAFITGSLGLLVMWSPIRDGSVYRLIDKV